jgi:hypothetical protein
MQVVDGFPDTTHMVITIIRTEFAGLIIIIILTDTVVGDMVIVFAGKASCLTKTRLNGGFFISSV